MKSGHNYNEDERRNWSTISRRLVFNFHSVRENVDRL